SIPHTDDSSCYLCPDPSATKHKPGGGLWPKRALPSDVRSSALSRRCSEQRPITGSDPQQTRHWRRLGPRIRRSQDRIGRQPAMERRLAAILAADVVGYSALMERDEAGTFARLKAGRKQLFEPEIERHHGRIFKLMGDGLLAEFGSVVNA